MCFDLAWNWGLDARAIADWLSRSSSAGDGWMKFNSVSNVQSHIAWVVALELAIYSASVDDRVTVGCFLNDHATAPPPTRKT